MLPTYTAKKPTNGVRMIFTLVMFLSFNYINGAYPFEHDITKMIGVEPAKDWLVFMEIRINRCIRSMPYNSMQSFLKCLVTRSQSERRCYSYVLPCRNFRALCIHGKLLTIQAPLWQVTPEAIVRNPRQLTIKTFVHSAFNMNVTLLQYTVTDKYHMQPCRNIHDCGKTAFIFKMDNGFKSCVYCGKHYPYNVYGRNNTVTFELHDTSYACGYVHVVLEIGVVDRYIVFDQCSSSSGSITWGQSKVNWYRINVDMLYRVMLDIGCTAKWESMLLVYDGPNANMPKLLNKHKGYVGKAFSTTFQVFVVHISNSDLIPAVVNFTALKNEHTTLRPNQQIYLRNNSDCGINNTKSWMCTYHILSPVGTQASIKVLSLNISGPYSRMFISAGVAIYNVVNQNRTLVAHWHDNIDVHGRDLVITGTENELYMTVFAYSPFAILSYHFHINYSACVGRFIGKSLRPSLMIIPHLMEYSNKRILKHFYIQFNVTRQCASIHILFLPTECLDDYLLIHIYTVYQQVLYIRKRSFKTEFSYTPHLGVDGNFYQLQGKQTPHTMAWEILGKPGTMRSRVPPRNSNIDMHVITVRQLDCLQSCHALKIHTTSPVGNSEMCDICQYRWIYNSHKYKLSYSPSHGPIQFERLHGSLPLKICVESVVGVCCGGHIFCYLGNVNYTLFQFQARRKIEINIEANEVWRTQSMGLRKIDPWDYPCLPHCPFTIPNGGSFRYGVYDYILANSFEVLSLGSWYKGNNRCRKFDAHLLTVFDRAELQFIHENIMNPYQLEHVFMGIKRRVRKLCQRQ